MDNKKFEFDFVRLVWIDYGGVRRCRAVPRGRLASIMETGVGIPYPIIFLPSHAAARLSSDPVGQPSGEARLIPDLSTLQALPWSPGESMVLVHFHREAETAGAPTAGPWDCCPRTVLDHALQKLKEEAGVSLMSGFETEFILFHAPPPDGTGVPIPIDQTGNSETAAFDTASPVLQQMCAALEEMGQQVEQVHAEGGPGQFEIVTRYSPAMAAADAMLVCKEVISSVARRNGMVASFLPKIWAETFGTGSHVHLSLVDALTGNLPCVTTPDHMAYLHWARPLLRACCATFLPSCHLPLRIPTPTTAFCLPSRLEHSDAGD